MTVLGTLLEITVYSALLYAAIMLFKTLFKKHASPMLQYLVWFLLVARLLVPITLDIGFSLITIPAAQTGQANASESYISSQAAQQMIESPLPVPEEAVSQFMPYFPEQYTASIPAALPAPSGQSGYPFDASSLKEGSLVAAFFAI